MSDEHAYEDPDAWIDEQERQEKRRKKKFKIILASLIILMIPAGLASIPAYRAIKEWRANTLAQEALTLLESEIKKTELYIPYEKATAAYQLAPGRILPQRAIATIYSITYPPHAYKMWKEVIAQDDHTLEDRLNYTKAAFAMRDMNTVAKELRWFYENHSDYTDAAVLRIKWLISEKRYKEALIQARELSQRTDIEPEKRLLYIQLGATSNDPNIKQEAANYLASALEGYTPLSLVAARIGYAIGGQDQDLSEKIMLKLRNHPDATIKDKLNSYSLQFQQGFITKEEVYTLTQKLVDFEKPEEIIIYLRWLNANGAHARAVNAISTEDALSRRDLFILHLDALAGTGNWEGIAKLLKNPKSPLEDFLKEVFTARYHYEMGDSEAAQQSWDRALLACEKRRKDSAKRLWWIEDYAKKLGWSDKRRSVLKRLTEIPSAQRIAYERLITLEKAEGDIRALLSIYKDMLKDYPDDIALLNDYAYLRLLIAQDVRESFRISRDLVESHPTYLSFRVTLALAYLRIGQPENALAVLKRTELEWKNLPDHYKLIAALTLASVGDRVKANEFLSTIDPSKLMPEELALIKQ